MWNIVEFDDNTVQIVPDFGYLLTKKIVTGLQMGSLNQIKTSSKK
jgi:hypothetical protein